MSTTQADRRKFLRLGLSASCALVVPAIVTACDRGNDAGARAGQQHQSSGSKATEPAKLSKADAKYQDRPQNGEQCSGCRHFQADANRCAVVAGEISPDAWCSLWVGQA